MILIIKKKKGTPMSVINGTAYFASVTDPNTNYEPVWSINVCDLDKESMKTVVEDNLILKPANEKHPTDYVVIKQKVNKLDGSGKFNPPKVIDAAKETWDGSKIGNGSKVTVLYTPRAWKYAGNKGVTADLKTVQVLDLIPYVDTSGDDEFKVVEGGYVCPPSDEKDAFAS